MTVSERFATDLPAITPPPSTVTDGVCQGCARLDRATPARWLRSLRTLPAASRRDSRPRRPIPHHPERHDHDQHHPRDRHLRPRSGRLRRRRARPARRPARRATRRCGLSGLTPATGRAARRRRRDRAAPRQDALLGVRARRRARRRAPRLWPSTAARVLARPRRRSAREGRRAGDRCRCPRLAQPPAPTPAYRSHRVGRAAAPCAAHETLDRRPASDGAQAIAPATPARRPPDPPRRSAKSRDLAHPDGPSRPAP